MSGPVELPSVEECREFRRLVNVGLEAIGLEPLEFLEFDACEPGDGERCLSATNLFALTGMRVGVEHVYEAGCGSYSPLEGAVLAVRSRECVYGWEIPLGIQRVTRVFDAIEEYPLSDAGLQARLRARLVEAGVVQGDSSS